MGQDKRRITVTPRERLRRIRWGQAPAWRIEAREYVIRYYQAILPAWPEDYERILPNNRIVVDYFMQQLSEHERDQIENQIRGILGGIERNEPHPNPVTCDLIALVLACSYLTEKGVCPEQKSPATPLLSLFEAGYELHPSDAGLELCYATGMCTMPLPTRHLISTKEETV